MNATYWNIIQLIVRDGLRLLVRLILTRIMFPEDFGIIGMAVVFTGLVQTINELGLGSALIQRKEELLEDIHYNTAFWTTLIFNIVTFIIMSLIVAPIAANFYEESLLKTVIVVLCLPILLRPLVMVHRVKLIRQLKFKSIAISEIAGAIFSGAIGIGMALLGFGVWSLAFQGIATTIIVLPIIWKTMPWVPKRRFSKKAFYDIFDFGLFVLFKQVTIFFAGNVDYLIIGKILGSYYVGIYTLAFTLTDVFRKQLLSVLNKVMFPVYSKVQDDTETAGKYFLKIVEYNTVIIFPIMINMIIYANIFIPMFFGKEWVDAVIPLQLICISVMFHVSTGSFSTVMTGLGKVKIDFIIYLCKTFLITVPLLFFFIKEWGIIGAGGAMIISKALSFILNIFLAKKFSIFKFTEIVKSLFPSLLGSIVLLIISFLFINLTKVNITLIHFLLYVILGLLVYLIVIYPFEKKEIKYFVAKLKDVLHPKK